MSYGRERQGSKTPLGNFPTIPYLERIVKSKWFHAGTAGLLSRCPGRPAVKQVHDQQDKEYHDEDDE